VTSGPTAPTGPGALSPLLDRSARDGAGGTIAVPPPGLACAPTFTWTCPLDVGSMQARSGVAG
jgi:hypothetical protein